MSEDFVSFDLAKKIKEKGFRYNKNNLLDRLCMENQINHPSISQVLKWLREDKRIDVGAVWDNMDGKWVGYINEMDMPDLVGEYVLPNTYDDYEQATIAGIECCLDNLT